MQLLHYAMKNATLLERHMAYDHVLAMAATQPTISKEKLLAEVEKVRKKTFGEMDALTNEFNTQNKKK